MNGIESSKQIRRFLSDKRKLKRCDQPLIIGVTGHAQDLYKQEGIKAGMDEVMSKPIYAADLKNLFSKYKLNLIWERNTKLRFIIIIKIFKIFLII